MKKILFIPDVHHPYHDKKAWALVIKAGKLFKPDTIAILGDFADFYSVSAHSRNPNRRNNLEYEVDETRKALEQLDSLGASKKIFIAGNHENRLERYLMDRAPELFNVVKIPDLFRLRETGWQYVPYKDDTRIGKLHLTHDTGPCGRNAIYQNLATYQHNVATGHTHRLAYVVEGNAAGEAHVSASFGWLGDRLQADYMHRVKAARDWALGFGVGYQLPNGAVHLVPIPIVNYQAIVEGKLVKL